MGQNTRSHHTYGNISNSYKIDITKLFIQWIMVIGTTGMIYYLQKDRTMEDEQSKTSKGDQA